MKIAIQKITDRGFDLEHKVLPDDWNLDGFDIKFINQIKFKGRLRREYDRIIGRVDVLTYREINCSRCLTGVCQTKRYNFHRSYQLIELGDFLDIGRDIREEILLNFSLRVLCSPDCRGLCPACGKNLNWGDCNCRNQEKES